MEDSIYVPFVGEFTYCEPEKETIVAGVSPIKFISLQEIADLEARTYADTPERIKGEEKLRSFLLACKHNEKMYGTSLSYEFRDSSLKLLGFSIALIGDAKNTKFQTYVKPLNKFASNTSECIYVSEWIAEKGTDVARVIFVKFFNDYVENFLAIGLLTPIVSEQRTSTSFELMKDKKNMINKIVKRRMQQLSEINSLQIERILGPQRTMGDSYHRIIYVPRRT